MSYYKVGDVIQMMRQALGMSQEKLCVDICSVQTLSRIENGKVSVKKKIYRRLMERMGRDGNKCYFLLNTSDFDMLNLMEEVNDAIFHREYPLAEEKLEILEKSISLKEDINYVFVKSCKAIMDGDLGRITRQEELLILEELISYTVPDYQRYLYKVYPFMYEEIVLLMNIANVYGNLGEQRRAINIYYMLIRSMNTGYMKNKDSKHLTIILISNAARFYGGMGQIDTAILMSWNAINKSKKNQLYAILPKCYGEIAWNMIRQIKNGDRSESDMSLCRQYLRQGYAIAILTRQNDYAEMIEHEYAVSFEEAIYGLPTSVKGDCTESETCNSICES